MTTGRYEELYGANWPEDETEFLDTKEAEMAVVRKEKGKGGFKKKNRAPERDEPVGDYRLPTTTTEPVNDLSDCLILIYGFRKIGKTSLLAQFAKSLVLATEIGYKGLRITKEDLKSWDRAQQVLRALRKDKTFKTVGVDTVDLLYRLAEKETYRTLGIEDLADAEWGRGWNTCRRLLSDYLNALTQTGKGVVLISHAGEQSIRQREGGEFDRVMPTMPKQAREVVEPMIDIWACYQYDGTRRILTIVGDEHLSAGHRFEERFRTPDGRRIKSIDMGTSPAAAYKNLNDAFHNRYTPTREEDIVEADRRHTRAASSGKKFTLKKR